MIKFKPLLILCLFTYLNGLNAQQKDSAIEFEVALTNDFNVNVLGGEEQGSSLLGNIDVMMTFDTEKAKLWKGGSFFVYGLANYGNSLSEFVGDIQGVNNIETENNVRLYQFYYNHQFKNFGLTIGQHDLNSEFAVSEFGSSFIHSSFGIQPDISANIGVSIFPVATLGVIAKWETSKLAILAAAYNGNPGSEMANPNSLNWNINKAGGMMSIVEFQYKHRKDSLIQSTCKIGLWNHSANTISLDEERNYNSSQGVYFIGDYKLYRENSTDNQGLGAFVQLGIAPQSSHLIKYYTGVGMTYQGLFPKREEDELGLAFGYAALNDAVYTSPIYNNNESIIELTYHTIISSNFSFQPDFQYIINPGGMNSNKNAFVCSVRTVIEF